MTRHFKDWIVEYVRYAGVTEAPRRLHFWAGVGAIAGALRRRVWIDMKRFKWYPSFYVVYVAPPGIVAKSTTADIAMDLLKQVPGVKFGPNSITWQALVTAFAAAAELFEFEGEMHPMAALTFSAAELGSLIDLQNRDMVNLLIELWDGKKSYEKITKTSGNDLIEAPWINIQGCTTPHWIADNMPAATIGGGLSSRCVFVFADKKERYVAYVDEMVNGEDALQRQMLIDDLERIATDIVGPFTITQDARAWGRQWYESFWKQAAARMDDKMLEGYAARKQTHLHKLAMVLSASKSADRLIRQEDLELADSMLVDIEADMPKVFGRIGRTEESLLSDKLCDLVLRKGGMKQNDAYSELHPSFPDYHQFEIALAGLVAAGKLKLNIQVDGAWLRPGA